MNRKKLTNIGIVPTVREVYLGQFEHSYDSAIKELLNKIYRDYNLVILDNNSRLKNLDLIIFSGGNDILMFSKKKNNKIRNKIDLKILKESIKKNIPILGICHGMQMIANFFGSKIVKKKHVGNHKIIYFEDGKKLTTYVNSFHNYVILKLSNKFHIIALANDGSCEAMLHKKKRILGIMWHPERYRKIKKFDVKLIKKYLCN